MPPSLAHRAQPGERRIGDADTGADLAVAAHQSAVGHRRIQQQLCALRELRARHRIEMQPVAGAVGKIAVRRKRQGVASRRRLQRELCQADVQAENGAHGRIDADAGAEDRGAVGQILLHRYRVGAVAELLRIGRRQPLAVQISRALQGEDRGVAAVVDGDYRLMAGNDLVGVGRRQAIRHGTAAVCRIGLRARVRAVVGSGPAEGNVAADADRDARSRAAHIVDGDAGAVLVVEGGEVAGGQGAGHRRRRHRRLLAVVVEVEHARRQRGCRIEVELDEGARERTLREGGATVGRHAGCAGLHLARRRGRGGVEVIDLKVARAVRQDDLVPVDLSGGRGCRGRQIVDLQRAQRVEPPEVIDQAPGVPATL